MGKALIIKGADFSANAVGIIDEMYEDITDSAPFVQGFVSRVSSSDLRAVLYNSSYNSSYAIIANYLTFMTSESVLYDTSDKGIEWFIPSGLNIRGFVYKNISTISSSGLISDSHTDTLSITGAGQWVSAADIYQLLGVSKDTYPCYAVVVYIDNATALTLAEAKMLGLRVRKLKATE